MAVSLGHRAKAAFSEFVGSSNGRTLVQAMSRWVKRYEKSAEIAVKSLPGSFDSEEQFKREFG
jgi:hypothetical protein